MRIGDEKLANDLMRAVIAHLKQSDIRHFEHIEHPELGTIRVVISVEPLCQVYRGSVLND